MNGSHAARRGNIGGWLKTGEGMAKSLTFPETVKVTGCLNFSLLNFKRDPKIAFESK